MIFSLLLLFVATLYYPGGSQADRHSIGFSWMNNYLCNLFDDKAMNGKKNAAMAWAICGMLMLCASFAIFFYRFSKKMPSTGAAKIVRYVGAGSMAGAFLAVTPLHNLVIIIAGTGTVLAIFYITVFVVKSKLHGMKILSALCLLSFFASGYLYFTRNYLEWLPIVQKINFLITMIWALCLEYFTTAADFNHSVTD
jgi:hypothetical protein